MSWKLRRSHRSSRLTRALIGGGIFAALALLAAAPAWARQWGRPPHFPHPVLWPEPRSTPEIDPGALRGALTLLAGGMLVLTDRRRSR
jgi:hypothetical protein